jgi:hypothetical protein
MVLLLCVYLPGGYVLRYRFCLQRFAPSRCLCIICHRCFPGSEEGRTRLVDVIWFFHAVCFGLFSLAGVASVNRLNFVRISDVSWAHVSHIHVRD